MYRDETQNLLIGGLLFDPENRIGSGALVSSTGKLPSIYIGSFMFGTIVDPLGQVILNSGKINSQNMWTIESPSPGIIDRESAFEALQTGLLCIDAMVPIGRGQRELVIGDRQTGKTSIGLDTILNQRSEGVFCVYVELDKRHHQFSQYSLLYVVVIQPFTCQLF